MEEPKNIPSLRFPEFTGEWENRRLDTIISRFMVPMRDKPKDLTGDIPWCRIEDFNGKYLTGSISNQGVSLETVKKMNLKIYPKDTLLVSCSANLGFCAIVKRELITNQTFIGLVPEQNKVDIEYLYYVMILSAQKLNTLSSGTTITYLSREQFEKFTVQIPSLPEQNRIASFFTVLDKKIIELKQKKTLLEQYKKGVMQKLFSQELRFKDNDGKEFPKWEKKKIKEIFQINAGGDIDKKYFSKEKTENFFYPVYSNSESNKGLFGYSDIYKVEKHSITVSGRGALGYAVARFEKYYPIVRLLILTPIIDVDIFFYENLINTTNFFVESTGVPQLTAPQISNYKIAYPHLSEQKKIANFLSAIDEKINHTQTQIQQTEQYKKGLLQEMFC
jgi:type I restriction enzyme S subunit